MQITKQNIVSLDLVLSENILANNFSLIQREFLRIQTQIEVLNKNSISIINKLNDLDPDNELDFEQPPQQHTHISNPQPHSQLQQNLQYFQQSNYDDVMPGEGFYSDLGQGSRNGETKGKGKGDQGTRLEREKQGDCRVEVEEGRKGKNKGSDGVKDGKSKMEQSQRRGGEPMIRDIVKDIQARLKVLENQNNSQKLKLSALEKQNGTFKRMLGLKQSKQRSKKREQKQNQSRQKKQENEEAINFEQLYQETQVVQDKIQQNGEEILNHVEGEEKDDIEQGGYTSPFSQELLEMRGYLNTKLNCFDSRLQQCFNKIGQANIELSDIKSQSLSTKTTTNILNKKLQTLTSTLSTSGNSPGHQYFQSPSDSRTKTTHSYENRTPMNKSKTAGSQNLNDTIESYKNYYEDKIMEIFQEMDRMRAQFVYLLDKVNVDSGFQSDLQRGCKNGQGANQSGDHGVRKEISLVKRELRKIKEDLQDLTVGTTSGSAAESRTFIFKSNQNKEDLKDLSQKIHKLRQEFLGYVKDLQSKINANNDLAIVIQQIEVAVSECKILNGKKVNATDFDKFSKRIETRLNNFIQQIYEKQGLENEKQALLVKQPWFCLSCDTEIRNYTGKVGKAISTQKFGLRKANPDPTLLRRIQGKLPSIH